MRPVEGSIRFWTAASGTSLTRTQIFTSWPPVANGAWASYYVELRVNRVRRTALRGSPARRSAAPSARSTPAYRVLDEVDDRLRRGARREHLGHAELLELRDVVGRDRAADGQQDVVDALLAQELDDPRHQGHVRAREDRQADGVGVLLDDGRDDLLGRLVQARVDDLHPRVAERAGDDLRAPVVPVEAGLGDHDADLLAGARGGHRAGAAGFYAARNDDGAPRGPAHMARRLVAATRRGSSSSWSAGECRRRSCTCRPG